MQNLQLISGHSVIELSTVDSTNNYAAKLLKDKQIGHGTVILSGFQEQGKGQRGNIWQSEPGKNLLLSYVIAKPLFNSDTQYFANKAVSAAISQFVFNLTDKPCQIKWPNDILLGAKKLAGVLIENSWRNDQLAHSIIGIGLNVNQLRFEGITANSLALEMGTELQLVRVLKELLESLDMWLDKLQKKKFEEIDKYYHMNLFRLHSIGEFEVGDTKFKGKIIGVSENGELLLEQDNVRRKYQNKEISFIY